MLCTFAPGAFASTWVFLNGDRLTGNLVGENAQTITVEHPSLGRLTFPRTALATGLSGAATVPVATAGKSGGKRQIEFGYAYSAGRASGQNLSLRVEIDRKDGPDTYTATARVLRAESDGLVSADQRTADFRWRHELTSRVFAQTLTTWSADPKRSIDQSLEQQVGTGVKLLASGGSTANLGVGAAVRYQDRAAIGEETAVLGTVFADFAHAWGDGLKFSEQASVALASDRPFSPASGAVSSAPVPVDGGNYRVRLNTLFQGKVTKRVTFNLRYDLDYDRSVPDPSGRMDRRLTSSLGYAW